MSSRFRIAEVAPLYASVPPVHYGGTERIVHCLTEMLVKQGHEVTLFAAAGAQTTAKFRAVREEPLFETWKRKKSFRAELAHVSSVAEVLRDAEAFDVIHFQLGSFSIPFSAIARTATVHSLPSPVGPDDAWNLMRYPHARVTARSHRQVKALPARRRRKIDIVYNGCDFDFFPAPSRPGRNLVFLGRMAPVKNPVGAIRLALRADIPIVLAGVPVEEGDRQYFESEVRPLLDNRMVTWIGSVDDAGKRELFADAAALLFPIQWEEAFGIVMIEAMACGVPVVACGFGSVPEVVDFGVTGYYSEEEDKLAELIPRALQLDRGSVRRQARLRFSREVMTDAYVRVFRSAIAGFRKTAR